MVIDMQFNLKQYEAMMERTIEALGEEFAVIRAGRANPRILDGVRVDYYGTPSPIQAVANISVPEPRLIQIQPWESNLI